MVRTRADNTARKAVAAKAPRKVLAPSGGGGGSSSGAMAGLSSPAGKYAGGNPVCVRPTPDWQKGIQGFLLKSPPTKDKENEDPVIQNTTQSSSCSGSGGSSSTSSSQESSSSSAGTSSTVKNGLISDSDED